MKKKTKRASKKKTKRAAPGSKAPAGRKKKSAAKKKASPAKPVPAKKAAAKRAPAKKKPAAKRKARTISHVVFGEVTVDPKEGVYWTKTLKLADRDIAVDLTLEKAADATPDVLDKNAQFVARLAHFDALARAGMRHSPDDDSDSAVAQYVTHHLETLAADKVTKMLGKPKGSVSIDDFLAATFLCRVGLYPAQSGGYATFDYTIDRDATQYVLSVRFDEDGHVLGIEMES